MATERKRFFKEGDVLKCEWGVWHEDTQTMPTAFVRDATPDEIEAYNAEHLEAAVETPKPLKPEKHAEHKAEPVHHEPVRHKKQDRE